MKIHGAKPKEKKVHLYHIIIISRKSNAILPHNIIVVKPHQPKKS